jgi:adenylate cyclase
MGQDEVATLAQLKALQDEVIDPKIDEYGGRVVKLMGDGILIEFPSAVDAVNYAVDVQRSMGQRYVAEVGNNRIQLRIGINVGDVIVDGEDIFGDGVNVAARMEAIADPDGITVSGTVYDQVRGKLHLPFQDLGEKSLKNIAEPVRVFAIAMESVKAVTESEGGKDAIFRRPAVAVLPFENLSDEPGQAYFADGLTEDIITELSLWRSFPVIARNSTFVYKDQATDIRLVGKELGARYVIEGSVRKVGDRIRVTAQLINAETGHHAWAERYDRNLVDIFNLQDEITARIAATVVPELERAEHKLSTSKKPQNLDAWDCYLRGWAYLYEFSEEGNLRAREMFGRAAEIDPNYSRAYSGLTLSCTRDLLFGFKPSLRSMRKSQSLEYSQRAVELDDQDSVAHSLLGIAYDVNHQNEDAFGAYIRAEDISPSNPVAVVGIGFSLTNMGRPEEGIPYIERGLQLNPRDPRNHVYFWMMARAHFTARRYDAAIDWAQRAVKQHSNAPEPHLILAASFGHSGNIETAGAELTTAETLRPGVATPSEWTHVYSIASDNEHFLDGLRKAGWEG